MANVEISFLTILFTIYKLNDVPMENQGNGETVLLRRVAVVA